MSSARHGVPSRSAGRAVPLRSWPAVGVGAVVIRRGRVLLIRRGKEPLKGCWSVPGGTVEAGETLERAVVREVREETGLEVRPTALLTVFDRIDRERGELRFHYVIVDYLCEDLGGRPRAGSDAEELTFAEPDELERYELTPKALEVIRAGLARS